MLKLIYRQRRRIILSSFFITLMMGMLVFPIIRAEGTLEKLYSKGPLLGTAILGTTALIIFLGASALVVATVVVLPRLRFLWDSASIVLFLLFVLKINVPELDALPYIGSIWPILFYVTMAQIISGPALDRFPVKVRLKQRRSFVLNASPEAVWSVLVPTPEHQASHWDDLLRSVVADPVDPDKLNVTYHAPGGTFHSQLQNVLVNDYPHHYAYAHFPDRPTQDTSKPDGSYYVHLTRQENGKTRVEITSEFTALPPAQALQLWLDDNLGSDADSITSLSNGTRDWSTTGQWRRKIAPS